MSLFKKTPYRFLKNRAFGQRIKGAEWVTNGHFLIIVDRVTLPYSIAGGAWKMSQGILHLDSKPPSFAKLLKEPKKLIPLTISPFVYIAPSDGFRRRPLFMSDGLTWVNDDYLGAITDCDLKVEPGEYKPIRAYSKNKLVGIVMPMLCDLDNVHQEQFDKLVKFLGQEHPKGE